MLGPCFVVWLVDERVGWFNLCFTSHQQLRSYGDGSQLNVSSDRLEKPRIEPTSPDLQGEWSTHYTHICPFVALL